MKIKLNDKFYRYISFGGLFEYIVKGIRNYEDDEQYELECQACTHGDKCLLLCAFDDKKKLQYIRALNNDEDNSQTYWHQNSGQFYPTKKEALIDKCHEQKKYWEEKVVKAEQGLKNTIESRDKELKLWNDLIDGLKE